MLLYHQTYLLYAIQIKLKSAKAYEAIKYFMNTVIIPNKKISDKFLIDIEADVDAGWLDDYNQFFRLYLDMGFKIDKIETALLKNLTKNDGIESGDKKPIIEFCEEVERPNHDPIQYKIAYFLDADNEALAIEDLNTLD